MASKSHNDIRGGLWSCTGASSGENVCRMEIFYNIPGFKNQCQALLIDP